jgi:hypothetical protein
MAAFVKFAPTHGVMIVGTIRRTNPSIAGALRRYAQARPTRVRHHHGGGRPTLVCHWQQGADRRLSCHWDIEVPTACIPPL